MKAPPGPVRMPGTAKQKAKGTSGASKPRKSATKSKSPPKAGATGKSASQLIDERIRDLDGWRGETLARMRALILDADPEMTEEWKWVKPSNPGTPVWSHHGIVCTGATPSALAKRGLPPETRTTATFSPSLTLIGLASLAPG
jgi:hypothetical protein